MKTVVRPLLAVALCGASALLTSALVREAIRIAATSDAALLEKFSGSAYEDVFGFGFWPTWAAFLLLQLFAAVVGWLLIEKHRSRFAFPVLLLAFTMASMLSYSSFERQHALWQAQGR